MDAPIRVDAENGGQRVILTCRETPSKPQSQIGCPAQMKSKMGRLSDVAPGLYYKVFGDWFCLDPK
jgi:hypothetical protein